MAYEAVIRKNKLNHFFPCYNDRETIEGLIKKADNVAREWTDDYEIFVIDDGSSDGSQTLLKNLASEFPRLKLIFHQSNQGYGVVLQDGFRNASKEWVFYTDGDQQYNILELR